MAKWQPGTPLEITTRRFVMRSLGPEQVDQRLFDWLVDDELMHFLGGGWRTPTIDKLRQSIARLYDNRSQFLLGIYHEDKLIGCYWIEGYLRLRTACTHHVLGDKDWWGKGVPLECREAILDWLFSVGFERIEGRPYTTCVRAVRNYIKQGWQVEGVARRATRDRQGKRHDNMLFAMLPEDWAAYKRRRRTEQEKEQRAAERGGSGGGGNPEAVRKG
jgi:RimJ/RimL family protein N-acetyltransferase